MMIAIENPPVIVDVNIVNIHEIGISQETVNFTK